jgi:VTC domain
LSGFDDQLQLQRWELKYQISPARAFAVREYIRGLLVLDKYAVGPDGSYSIYSIYLDTPDLDIYADTVGGKFNRYKLRVRYYGEKPSDPVFAEVKRRTGDAILKQRAGLRREALADVLAGRRVDHSALYWPDGRSVAALDNFIALASVRRASPVAFMSYDREAWVSQGDNTVRVTFDRRIRITPWSESGGPFHVGAYPVFPSVVILELKFTGRYPAWFSDLVQIFDLRRDGASKYCEGLEIVGLDRIQPASGRTRRLVPSGPPSGRDGLEPVFQMLEN